MGSPQNPKLILVTLQNNMQTEVMQKFGLKMLPYTSESLQKKNKK
jgi:hypothetical protein